MKEVVNNILPVVRGIYHLHVSAFKYINPCGVLLLQEMNVPLLSLSAKSPLWGRVFTSNQTTV